MRHLFQKQQQYLNFFFDHIDIAQAENVLNICLNTKGLILLTGVGKSGFVAEKIAMTLVATGTRAIYLSPLNFLHGDMGIISELDTIIFLSKSGETEELLQLVPFIKKKGATLVACISNKQSRLAKQVDEVIFLPIEKELCPYDLTPTTSTEIQLLFGDAIAIGLMQKKYFTLTQFGENHPSGAIGRKIITTVEDVMIPLNSLPLCSSSQFLSEILSPLTEKGLGCILIVDKMNQFEGIFTDGDLRRSLQSLGSEVMQEKIGHLMTKAAITIDRKSLAWDALKIMQKDPNSWIMMLPVLEERSVVGLVRMHDIIHQGIS